jgi:HD-GYP domain-containing protein (c-di-GMP phosphodiesterase class II)
VLGVVSVDQPLTGWRPDDPELTLLMTVADHALDEAEWREIRQHPEIGARILEHAGMTDIAGWVRAHHERLDGHGYPGGLPPSEIALEARILAVADAYEAMVTDRPYHTGIEPAEASEDRLVGAA